MKICRLLPAIVFLFASVTFIDARPTRMPSYRDLLSKSDLVVIATPTATSDTKEQIDLPGISVIRADNTSEKLSVIGVETKFHVSAVLKGEQGLKDFVLHHYREANESELPVVNGVMLVSFDPSKPISFLLFLVREPDGRFAPFDQTDPALVSVQKLQSNTAGDSAEEPTRL